MCSKCGKLKKNWEFDRYFLASFSQLNKCDEHKTIFILLAPKSDISMPPDLSCTNKKLSLLNKSHIFYERLV